MSEAARTTVAATGAGAVTATLTAAATEDRAFWRAMPWAILAWLVLLWLLGRELAPSHELAPALPVDARLVELPDSPAAAASPTPPAPVPPPVLKPRDPLPSKVPDKTPDKMPVPVQSPPKAAAPAQSSPPPTATAKASAPVASTSNNTGLGTDNHGAQAQYKPDPKIPDELADGVADMAVGVRVHVAADGSTVVELSKRTPDPRVNKIVLDTVKQWTFTPAVQAGKSIASTVDLSIRL